MSAPAIPTNADIDAVVYACRQAGDDTTYAIVRRAIEQDRARAAAPSDDESDTAALLRKYKKLCVEIGRGDSYHLSRIDRAIESVAAAPQAAVGVSDLDWEPLPEDARERAQFDRSLSLYQHDPRLAVATALELWGKTNANGSFARQCCVMANEVAKLRLPPFDRDAEAGSPNPWRDEVQRLSEMASTALHQRASDQRNILEDIADRLCALLALSPATKPEAPAGEQQKLMIDFDQVGTAGPFPVVDGRVHLPSETMLDLARMLKPTMDSLAAADVPAVEQEASQREKAHKGPLVGEQVPPSINEVNRTAVVADDAIVDPAYLAAYEAAGRVGQIATPPAKAPAEAPANEGVSDAESLYEFKVRLTEYGLAMRNGNGEKARVLAEVLASMLSTATQPMSADVSQVSDVLVYVDAGHLREVLNGNDMCIFASAQQDEQGRLTPLTALAAPAQGDAAPLSQAAQDVLAERQRQISTEGWTPEHDDEHRNGSLSAAAATYALAASDKLNPEQRGVEFGGGRRGPGIWPWSRDWWKPGAPRRMLIKAGALILAEAERLDRAARQSKTQGDQHEQQ